MDDGAGVGEAREEEDDFFLDIETGDVVGERMASGRADDDVEAGFLFDFAEGGGDFGLAGFGVAFGKTSKAVLLGDEEDFAVMDDDGAAGFFGNSVGVRMSGIERLRWGVARDIKLGRSGVHGFIIMLVWAVGYIIVL